MAILEEAVESEKELEQWVKGGRDNGSWKKEGKKEGREGDEKECV